MRSTSLSLAMICVAAASPANAEDIVRQGAAAAGGTAGAIGGSAVGGPIGGAVGGVVGGAIAKGTVGVIGAIIPGGGKKKKLRKAQLQAEAQAQAGPPVLTVQPQAASGQAADAATLASEGGSGTEQQLSVE